MNCGDRIELAEHTVNDQANARGLAVQVPIAPPWVARGGR